MTGKSKKYQRSLLIVLIVICMGIIVGGGVRYIEKLQSNLRDNAIQNVLNVTIQQRQAFDNFISGDRERLHSYADYFALHDHSNPQEVQQLLTMFKGVDATCMIMCLDEGWFCASISDQVHQVEGETLEVYRQLTGNGVRDNYIGLLSGVPKFSYYEEFTFKSGHRGLIQKSYDRSKVLETFSLSLYDGRGYGYILDQNGDILLRSVPETSSGRTYDNVFTALTDTHSPQEDINAFRAAMSGQETGSIIFTGDNGRFVYTYTPLESLSDWYLLSIVPIDAIREEAEQMLRDTQTTLGILIVILLLCGVFILLIWRTHKDIAAKDQEAQYQAQLFDVFTSYLSRNTDDIYLMLNHDTNAVEYISPNVEQVMGVKPEDLIRFLKEADMAEDPQEALACYDAVAALKPGEASEARSKVRVNPKTGERRFFLENVYCVEIQGKRKRVVYFSARTKERKSPDPLADSLLSTSDAADA